jgi:hypothetical protein
LEVARETLPRLFSCPLSDAPGIDRGVVPGLTVADDHIVFEPDMGRTFDASPFVCDGVDVLAGTQVRSPAPTPIWT